ncbi:RraA famliy [Micromonospora pallida]|uniref:Putative 4-hydroxy-4-methyl-2-oxoglutarate aldolase n=1 Tax=Micromonospora pallida TaxID=145854 RepID=A0A1C6S7J2_9ACTN|nr:VOC family protein [Micromonospora pallida]SCL25416.1 RraA famliy [Micromonospora pallida]
MTTVLDPTPVPPQPIRHEDLARMRRLPTANIADAMQRLNVCDSAIQAVWPGATICGPAFTVLTRSGDNAQVHEALKHVRPGEVIVVSGGGDTSRALIGELIAGRAANLGVAGFVLDGAARDAEAMGEMGMPVFARATTPAGPYKNGPGALGRCVAIGGVAVRPGDLIVADADGVVVVPVEDVESVLLAAEQVQANETRKRAEIEAQRVAAGGAAAPEGPTEGGSGLAAVDHIDVRVPDLDAAVTFFESLGLQIRRRLPEARRSVEMALPGPGQVVFEIRQDDSVDRTVVDHVAFRVAGTTEAITALKQRGVDFTRENHLVADTGRRVSNFLDPGQGRWQLAE